MTNNMRIYDVKFFSTKGNVEFDSLTMNELSWVDAYLRHLVERGYITQDDYGQACNRLQACIDSPLRDKVFFPVFRLAHLRCQMRVR